MDFTIPAYTARSMYLERIVPYVGKNVIKVLTGQRRTGKSYMLFQIMDHIKQNKPRTRIIYINKELHEFSTITTSRELLDHITASAGRSTDVAVFIDEIQDIAGFEKALRSLAATGQFDLYCTGSNANLLSGELATYLAGRYVEIKIYGLSFDEFLLFHKLPDSDESLMTYLKYGGLPFLVNIALEDRLIYDYLRNIYDAILYKDIITRHKIRNVSFLERLTEYVAGNVGSLVSAKKISDFLKSQKTNISPNIVLDYLSFLSSAFFILRVHRSDIIGKKIFEIGEKYYFEDLGLRHTLVGFQQADIGKILENIVCVHLMIHGFRVTVGKLGDREIDFVADRGSQRLYVQVAYVVPDKKTHDREFGNLGAIDDNYRKLVVSMDASAGGNYKGIEHVHIRKFLRLAFN